MKNNFLPKNYTVPESNSKYMKFKQGLNRFRVLSTPAVIGYEYFTKENKPVRSKEKFKSMPNIKEDGTVKHFWAFVVWNYDDKSMQILEITQKTIMKAMIALNKNEKWGNPTNYDIAIIKKGESLDTEYTVQAEPPIEPVKKDIAKQYKETTIDLEALFEGNNPFEEPEDKSEKKKEAISVGDIPF